MTLEDRCRDIQLVLSDVDGVMTDGGVLFDNQAIETKKFYIRDGLGVKLWQRAGGQFGLLTGRTSHIVRVRADELDIDIVRQGVDDKLVAANQLFGELEIEPEQVCYLGDDLPDLPVLRAVGFAVTVADGCEEARQAADYVTVAAGGGGAVRETVEVILKAQGRWEDLIKKYTG